MIFNQLHEKGILAKLLEKAIKIFLKNECKKIGRVKIDIFASSVQMPRPENWFQRIHSWREVLVVHPVRHPPPRPNNVFLTHSHIENWPQQFRGAVPQPPLPRRNVRSTVNPPRQLPLGSGLAGVPNHLQLMCMNEIFILQHMVIHSDIISLHIQYR